MASRPISPEQMLAAIPSLPRPMLTRLVDQMIDRLDELDGDADDEDNSDAEPIDEREPEEEYGLVAGSPIVPFLDHHVKSPRLATFSPGCHMSIRTRTALLLILMRVSS